jgi:hypothetical protein
MVVPAVFAATPDDACWGVVTKQFVGAVGGQAFGDHVSSQSEPRLGLGNVNELFLGTQGHVYMLGSFLASIDGLPQTSCP